MTDSQTAETERANVASYLRSGAFEQCIRGASSLIERDSDDWESLYLLAVAQRYSGDIQGAHRSLDRLLNLKPDYGRAHQELGHLLRRAGEVVAAIAAYYRAVQHNPALASSWRALAELHGQVGKLAAAATARQQADHLAGMPAELVAIQSFFHEGRLLKAERLARDILQRDPRNVEAMRMLASIAAAMNVMDEAEFLLESAHVFDPRNLQVHVDYAGMLHKRQKFDLSLKEAEALLAKDPANPVFLTLKANALLGLGEFAEAVASYDAVLRQWPHAHTVHLSRGHALKTVGRQNEAVDAYRDAYRCRPDFGDAYWSLANLKTYGFSPEEVAAMERAAEQPRTIEEDRIHLEFALGKAFEDRREYDRSFVHYERGNALRRQSSRFEPEMFDDEVVSSIENCAPELFAGAQGAGNPARDPIFIVGLPRAGSTLIEQILASHSEVEGTAELPTILSLVNDLRSSDQVEWKRYQPYLKDLDAADLVKHGDAYMERSLLYRSGLPRFLDKMPNNFRHIAFIKLILPNAKIIDARRHPMACCFSGFKQLFAEGQEFSYGLEDIGRYYAGYVRLMRHWDDVLPGSVLRIHYENVVEDIEGQVRRILDFCELPFEDGCVEFHKTERAVRTASSEQVRQPLFRSGLEQWMHYERHLTPLAQALGDVLTGYEADRARYR